MPAASPDPQSSRPPTSAAPTTCRWPCSPSTPTRSPPGWTASSCWSAAPAPAPARPISTWPESVSTGSTSSTAASPPTPPPSVPATPPWFVAERQVRLVAGSLVLAGLGVGLRFPAGRLLAAGIGAGLTVSAMTDTCTLARLLALLPYNRGPGDRTPDQMLAQLP